MRLARVTGKVTGTVKANRLGGYKFLVVNTVDGNGNLVTSGEVVADELGAGEGDWVLIANGSAARYAFANYRDDPIDAAVVMIVDEALAEGRSLTVSQTPKTKKK